MTGISGIFTDPLSRCCSSRGSSCARPTRRGGKRKRELESRTNGRRATFGNLRLRSLRTRSLHSLHSLARHVLALGPCRESHNITSHNVRATNEGGAGREERTRRTLPRMRFISDAASTGNTTAAIVPKFREVASRASYRALRATWPRRRLANGPTGDARCANSNRTSSSQTTRHLQIFKSIRDSRE